LKKYLNRILLFLLFTLFPLLLAAEEANKPVEVEELFRSNANGLALVAIEPDERDQFSYVLTVLSLEYGPEGNTTRIPRRKRLYQDKVEIKRWDYIYSESNMLTREKYYKGGKIAEQYRYDGKGHKTSMTEYKNQKRIRTTSYRYNKHGLVHYEEIYSVLRKQKTVMRYRYDKYFRIKQIEKRYPDGRIVYWEAFFSQIGIILKEYYTLDDEIFTFLYDKNGQETGGVVKSIDDEGNKEVKLEWDNYYSQSGKKERKVTQNYLIDKKTGDLV